MPYNRELHMISLEEAIRLLSITHYLFMGVRLNQYIQR